MEQAPYFLNVQFELRSDQDLTSIVKFLGDRVLVHYNGSWESKSNLVSLSLATADLGGDRDPETIISSFCDLIDAMPAEVRSLWDACSDKRFDVGFESGNVGNELNAVIGSKTLSRSGRVGADLVITVYPVR